MLLNKLKQFHQQTMERYRDEENMEPWKKAVMEIHDEANLREGKISATTPIAKGLLGKKVGDIAEIQVPSGLMSFEIVDISI